MPRLHPWRVLMVGVGSRWVCQRMDIAIISQLQLHVLSLVPAETGILPGKILALLSMVVILHRNRLRSG